MEGQARAATSPAVCVAGYWPPAPPLAGPRKICWWAGGAGTGTYFTMALPAWFMYLYMVSFPWFPSSPLAIFFFSTSSLESRSGAGQQRSRARDGLVLFCFRPSPRSPELLPQWTPKKPDEGHRGAPRGTYAGCFFHVCIEPLRPATVTANC